MRIKPPAKIESEQLNIRLPVPMIVDLKNAAAKAGRPLSKEIRERLARSLFEDGADPHLRLLGGQIEQLAKKVRRAVGAEWHADVNAHRTFVDAVTRFLAGLPEPAETTTTPKHPAAVIGEIIYDDYIGEVREIAGGQANMRPTLETKVTGGSRYEAELVPVYRGIKGKTKGGKS